MPEQSPARIPSIDLVRGFVMVVMALDHAKLYLLHGTFFHDPTDLSTTTAAVFWTRWVTHLCAPAFVFLAGTSAALLGRKVSTPALARFLVTRGLWLVLLEVVVIQFAWTFDPTFSFILLGVVWVIGASMVVLGGLVFLPRALLIGFGLVLVLVHNGFDDWTFATSHWAYAPWTLLHAQGPLQAGGWIAWVNYPLVPWIGVMALGYAFGSVYAMPTGARRRVLWRLAVGLAVAFVALRATNWYGDPSPWAVHDNGTLYTVMSFVNTTKYPPSLLYLAMTLAPMFALLALAESWHGPIARALLTFGRVPLFFYVTHIALAHLFGMAGLVLAGHPWHEFVLTIQSFSRPTLREHGFDLPIVYAAWVGLVVGLYPACRWFERFKARNRGTWWVSYL